MTKLIEYNDINIIPIKYPHSRLLRTWYYPRYKIINSEKLLNCFKLSKSFVNTGGIDFRYIKIKLYRKFKTVDIEELYYYILVEKDFNYELPMDASSMYKIFDKNNYILVTTPVLKYQDIYYNITNNSNVHFLYHTESILTDDDTCIKYLIENNCYSIADNLNILISLYDRKYIDEYQFLEMTSRVNDVNTNYITNPRWLNLMNPLRIKSSACDFYVIYLIQNVDTITNEIFDKYDTIFKGNTKVPLYIHDVYMYMTYCSCIYPNISEKSIDNIKTNMETNIHISIWGEKTKTFRDICIPDFYGYFASICKNDTLFKNWTSNYKKIINIWSDYHKRNINMILLYLLESLFRLYIYGFEYINVNKYRIHKIWKIIICKYDISDILYVFLNSNIVPLRFLYDIYASDAICFSNSQCIIGNDNVYKKYNYYEYMLLSNNNIVNIFVKHVLDDKLIFTLFILKESFKNDKYIIVYDVLVDYIKNNKSLLF